jgi:hypothetical protein
MTLLTQIAALTACLIRINNGSRVHRYHKTRLKYRSGAVAVRPKKFTLLSLLFLALSGSPAWAVSRYECKGVASETTVLTPFEDGSVDLSFNKGPVKATANFTHKGDVFMAEFANLERAATSYMVVFDTLTKKGYEIVRLPNLPAIAAKITCSWFDD